MLWATLVGAMIGSRTGKHIHIDLLTHCLRGSARKRLQGVVELFAGIVSGMAGFFSYHFVLMEYEFSGVGFATVPSWICAAIIPFAFSVICLRYLISSVINFMPGRNMT